MDVGFLNKAMYTWGLSSGILKLRRAAGIKSGLLVGLKLRMRSLQVLQET